MKKLAATILLCLAFFHCPSLHAESVTVYDTYDDLNRLTSSEFKPSGLSIQSSSTYDETGNTSTITNVSDAAPIASYQSVFVLEDNRVLGFLSCSDPDGDPLTYYFRAHTWFFNYTTEHLHVDKGWATITNQTTGAFTYIPDAGLSGLDSFTYWCSDSKASSGAIVTVNIAPVNDPPTAYADWWLPTITNEDTTTVGQLMATDPENDALTYTIVSNGTKGTATVIDPATGVFSYTPNHNAVGIDDFTFKVNDGYLDSPIASMAVTITPVNDPPIAQPGQLAANEDTAAVGQLLATDLENDALTFTIASNGKKGTATITDPATGAYAYAPNHNACGLDSFTFYANDGTADSERATVAVNITPVADPPPTGSVVDAPHNNTNAVTCGDCHSYSLWWQYAPLAPGSTLHAQVTEAICLTCHHETNDGSVKRCTHSSLAMGSWHNPDTGNWSSTCTACHDPHFQTQLDWRHAAASELYLVTGTIGETASFTSDTSTTTFAYANPLSVPAWSNPDAWSMKNNTTPPRGLILTVDTVNAVNTYEVVTANGTTITVKGKLDMANAGKTFGLIYGQLIKSTISAPNGIGSRSVKFFNPDDPLTGYIDTTGPPEGLCQVCHSLTKYWTADGLKNGHEATTKCTTCHEPTLGFQPVP